MTPPVVVTLDLAVGVLALVVGEGGGLAIVAAAVCMPGGWRSLADSEVFLLGLPPHAVEADPADLRARLLQLPLPPEHELRAMSPVLRAWAWTPDPGAAAVRGWVGPARAVA